MRKVILALSVSRDGFIEGPNGELDWLDFNAQTFDARDFLSTFDTLFYGRKAYEKIGVPPSVYHGFPEGERWFHYAFCGIRKYVFSRTRKHVAGNGMVVSGNLEAEVGRIRDEDGKNIWFAGGVGIMRSFAERDLIDQYIITVRPVMLHSGKALFEGGTWPANLTLIQKNILKSGAVILKYLPESRLNNQQHGRSF